MANGILSPTIRRCVPYGSLSSKHIRAESIHSRSESNLTMFSAVASRNVQRWPRFVRLQWQLQLQLQLRCSYFTNTDTMKRDDPYAQLGLQWGDGATLTEIKEAYKKKSLELHPDRNRDKDPRVASKKFQDLQRAYQTLVKVHSNLNGMSEEKDEEWHASVWRNGDRLALNRTDVAGVMKKRPAPAASSNRHSSGLLGSVSSFGRRGEYIGHGSKQKSSSVGRGLNKWVSRKEFKPWNGKTSARASDFTKDSF